MTLPLARARAAVTALLEQWREIDRVLTPLTDEQWAAPTALPSWSVQDVIAHIIGTEEMLAGRPTPEVDGVDAAEHVRNPIGAMNEAWVLSLRSRTPQQMLAELRRVIDERGATLVALTDDELEAPAMTPEGPGTYGSFMAIRLFDCWVHELDVRDAVGARAPEGGPRAEAAFTVIEKALPYVVGKKVGAPDGTRVRVEVTGDVRRSYVVEVDGRARFVDAITDEPSTADRGEQATTTITLDFWLYVRLLCGRVRAAEHRGDIAIEGDVALGTRLTDSLASTI